jgi:autotransporter-associated beta strand protein
MRIRYAFVFVFLNATLASYADTTWTAGANTALYSTPANWDNGLPSSNPPQLSIFNGNALLFPIRAIDIAGTPRNSMGLRFDFTAADDGFTFSTVNAAANIGLQSRAGGVNGIVNNDNSVQTFNVPFRMFTSAGASGAGAAQTINAAAGDIIFTGAYPGTSTNANINNNGGTLTIDGAFNTTIGTTGRGDIANTGGLIKNGSGILTLGGTMANTYSGTTMINAGRVVANKANALGTGPLVLNGGILETGGYSQMLGTLDLDSGSTINLGSGDSDLVFADSDSQDWGGSFLTILNWTEGVDSIRVGTDGTGFDTQLSLFRFADFGNAPGQIDANGFITPAPVPEPSTVALAVAGGLAILILLRRRT